MLYSMLLAMLLTIKCKRLLVQTCHQSHVSVCANGVLWQNSWMDLDAICSGEWGWLMDGVLDGGGDRRRRRGSFGGKCEASQWGLCCIFILCREGWWCGSSHIPLGFLVLLVFLPFYLHIHSKKHRNARKSWEQFLSSSPIIKMYFLQQLAEKMCHWFFS